MGGQGNFIVFVLFLALGLCSVASSWARVRRYRRHQRALWILTDAIFRGTMAVAMLFAALLASPHPVADFEILRAYARYAWLVAFVPFSLGVFLDWYNLAQIEKKEK